MAHFYLGVLLTPYLVCWCTECSLFAHFFGWLRWRTYKSHKFEVQATAIAKHTAKYFSGLAELVDYSVFSDIKKILPLLN